MHDAPLGIHHVGVAVPSIDDAMHFYGDKLGLSLVDSFELPDRQLKVGFVQAANMLIELLEPTDPNSTVSRFLERRGPGLHHLCFGTSDIRRHLRDLEDKGVELIDTAPRPGAHGEVAFLQPSAALGVLVELLQAGAEAPATEAPAAEAEPPKSPETAPETSVSSDASSPSVGGA
jgi:methylmalonyl-CoA/ethylmalonyl-CoA epimerase